jgi:hypothetical protein
MRREFLRKTGRLTQKDIEEEEAELAEKAALGLKPHEVCLFFRLSFSHSQSRWGEFLKKKKFTPKKHPGLRPFCSVRDHSAHT